MSDFSYEFSRLCLCDLDDLVALEEICFPHAWTEQQFWLCLKQKQYYIFGLKNGGELAAYMSFFNVADEMEILKLAVHPAYRRNGLGKRLLGLVLQNCIEMGIEQAYLEVRRSNTAALALYTGFGFIQTGTRKKYYPDNKEDATILSLVLPKSEREFQ
ncbi:MAG: ribosomal protein S18-alanine N-acetyltransferase [Thermodesulfobacteriota bacterium]|nr:ribosomal protein S18-alanine N-acetyltransferase [Thermodesulfobacteriota bacterium]